MQPQVVALVTQYHEVIKCVVGTVTVKVMHNIALCKRKITPYNLTGYARAIVAMVVHGDCLKPRPPTFYTTKYVLSGSHVLSRASDLLTTGVARYYEPLLGYVAAAPLKTPIDTLTGNIVLSGEVGHA
jgi:hypothetical protein